MSETDFDANLGRAVREYGQVKKDLKEIAESTQILSESLSALSFGVFPLNDGKLRDEGKAIDTTSGHYRYLDLESQLKSYGIDF